MEELISKFYHRMIGIRDITPFTVSFPEIVLHDLNKKYEEFLAEKCEQSSDGKTWRIPSLQLPHFQRLQNRRKSIAAVNDFVPESIFLGLIAKFDAFVGLLMKKCFEFRPELINKTNRQIDYCDIASFETSDEIRQYVIEKEIESVLRKSHIEHIKWFESKLGIKLCEDLNLIAEFIEITEARNLYAHCDGVISAQYIQNCSEYSIDLKGKKVGDKLIITSDYFSHATDVVLDVGFKMANIVWRTQSKENIEHSDKLILQTIYDLVDTARYKTAIRIGSFFADKKVTKNDDYYLPLLINLAQAYKWSDSEEWRSVLRKEHWNSKSSKYKLAKEVLMDEWDTAAKTMHQIGSSSSEISQEHYDCWPLFRKFRETDQFKKAYEVLFGVEFENKKQITSAVDMFLHDKVMTSADTDLPIEEQL